MTRHPPAASVLAIACVFFLGGCATRAQAERFATAQAVQRCAADGGQFLKTDSSLHSASLVTDYVVVRGRCVQKGESGWIEPPNGP